MHFSVNLSWPTNFGLRSVQRKAVLPPGIAGTALAEGETGNAEPDALLAFCLAPVRGLPPLRANSRSPLQEEYDSEWDDRSRRSLSGSSLCSWRESASITSSRSEPHFPGCFSGHHFPTKSASLLLLINPVFLTRSS